VVLDEEHAPAGGIVGDLRHIALFGADTRERLDPDPQGCALGEGALVGRPLHVAAGVDDPGQALFTQSGTHRGDELDGEVVVAIGKQILGEIGERPHGRRTTSTLGRAGMGGHESVVAKGVEMLANAGLGHVERVRQVGDLGVGALQPLDDSALGHPEIGLDVIHRELDYRNRTLVERYSPEIRPKGRPMIDQAVRAGTLSELRGAGQILTKVGSVPVVVFWHEDAAYAIEDRCPHLGFPLHQGTVEAGLVTCHWHHARFDLESGCTLDMWADDARGFAATVRDGDVFVEARADVDPIGHLQARLRNGLEESITLVIAKSVLGLLDAGVPAADIVRTGIDFGTKYRASGWGTGLTVLVAMANLFPHLSGDDRALALVHGLTFVANDTSGQSPRFPVGPLPTDAVPIARLEAWYRRFIETRSSDSAERTLETALHDAGRRPEVEAMMFTAVTDHVFIDGGHTLDFTNKAFEAVELLGAGSASQVLPTLVMQTTRAQRSEEFSEWRHPHDLVALSARTAGRMERPTAAPVTKIDVGAVAWQLLADDPEAVADALVEAWSAGATDEEIGRALAYAAALRIVRFHTRNDHADWDTVHHSFTAANALHQAMVRNPTPELRRAAVHAALRIYLDRFLNVPAARLPQATVGSIAALDRCFDAQGMVEEAANEAYGFLAAGGSRAELIAALGRALLLEDAGFHWYQTVEAGVRQATAWPDGSEESALILVGISRFLAAHTPTRRELPTVVRIAARLRRGEALYEDDQDA